MTGATGEGELWGYGCPNCGYDGPHYLFALNEVECGDCYAEFSLSADDYDRPESDEVGDDFDGGPDE